MQTEVINNFVNKPQELKEKKYSNCQCHTAYILLDFWADPRKYSLNSLQLAVESERMITFYNYQQYLLQVAYALLNILYVVQDGSCLLPYILK